MNRLLTCLLFLSLILLSPAASAQEKYDKGDWWVITAELHTRMMAVKTVMPVYPEEAVRRGIEGVTQIKVGIEKDGTVAKIKVQPGTDPSIKKALADAVRQWVFMPHSGNPERPERPLSLNRLTFHFIIENGEGRVQMYEPPPGAPEKEQINNAFSNKEVREWNEWEEIWTTRKKEQTHAHPTQSP
jgi:TonB family protein